MPDPKVVGSDPEWSRGASAVYSPHSTKLKSVAGFLFLSFPIGLFWFLVLGTLILLGVALSIIWVGLPILALALTLVTRAAQSERRRLARSLGVVVPAPYRPLPQGSWFKRAHTQVKDRAVRRDLAYLLLLLPVGVAEFTIVVAAFALPAVTVALPAWLFIAFPEGIPLWQSLRIDTLLEAFIGAVVILPASAFAAYLLVIGTSKVHTALGRSLLGLDRRARLAERVEELTESRSRVVEAAITERRRIERDLHDGAQRRLVSLAMGLGMAKEKMATEPNTAQQLVEEAHEEAKRALAEIRDLVRGIHPAVLSDRGLDAAISALASHCPVPVEAYVELDERLPEAAETTAYFVIAEALANVAKHSEASQVQVFVQRERKPQDRLVVEVVDDGKGGADLEAGSGLAGLADRLAALDGRLFLETRVGGPTRLQADLPLDTLNEPLRRTL